jgi:hypothetical protein
MHGAFRDLQQDIDTGARGERLAVYRTSFFRLAGPQVLPPSTRGPAPAAR